MKLSEIIATIPGLAAPHLDADGDIEIAGLTADSRDVEPGFLFAALPGTSVDGSKFVPAAIAAGASAVLIADDADTSAFEGQVTAVKSKNPRRDLALMAARFFAGQPKIAVAVTGTSGKTSVVEFTRQIFAACDKPAASVGTIGIVRPDGGRYGSLTTPDPVSLHRSLAELAGEGVTHLAFEASSHGLDQHRLDGVTLTAAAFTNLGRDHLDYHPDTECYFAAKLRLFTELLQPGRTAVVNSDGAASARVVEAAKARGLNVITTGKSGSDIRLISAERIGFAQQLKIKAGDRTFDVPLPLIGEYQVENALVAAGLATVAGIDTGAAIEALAKLNGVPGRLEIVGEVNGGLVVVDYAHKPEALEAALSGVRSFATGKLTCVFGCGGDRDRGKRAIMGRIAADNADVVVVTDDNPRSEDPAAIRAEILAGCPGATEIGDRREAIEWAVAQAGSGDVVLIAGKGHETGQIVGDTTLPFSDLEVAREAIEHATAASEPLWEWQELVVASHGLADGDPPTRPITGISIDSRAITPGDLFVALKDKRDGHEFVTNAFAAGAAAALVNKDYARQPGDRALVRVDDTLRGLEQVGIAARARLPSAARVIAVTGSVGKTTTKEMLRACFSRLGKTHAADKSFNNHLGVPLTLARMPRDTHYGIFEIGMNHAGEITPLTKMVRPHVAIITTVAPVHLENFESVADIAAAKAEILIGLAPGGTAILNRDNEHFEFLNFSALASGASISGFSAHSAEQQTKERADVQLLSSEEVDGRTIVSVALKDHPDNLPGALQYELALPGQHSVMNSLAVIAALAACGGDLAMALPALAELKAPQGRGERIELNIPGGKALLIDESYNANPVSMRAAIAVLASVPRDAYPRRIAVIGDMLELGADAEAFHAELAQPLIDAEVSAVFAAGKLSRALYEALPQERRGAWGETPDAVQSQLIAAIRPGDVVMIKGSNGARTWQLAAALRRQFASR